MLLTELLNKPNKIDGMALLDFLCQNGSETVCATFFDPQYRGILDKLNYGNEGKERGKDRCSLQQMDNNTIVEFIKKINIVLQPSGYLFLWVDKFHLCEGINQWIEDTELSVVDLITWDKEKIGMGYRTRRQAEYLLILQKAPIVVKDTWTNHSIPDIYREKIEKNHPHSKPVKLQQLLIEATTNEGDIVLDPAAGGYSVLFACLNCNRNFVGCDITTDIDKPIGSQLSIL